MRFLLIFVAAFAFCGAATVPTVELRGGEFVVRNWTPPAEVPREGWSSVLQVFVGRTPNAPPLLGEHSVTADSLTFRPRFPLSSGLTLRAVLLGREFVFETPRAVFHPTARVRQVYPTTSALPENQLKFYIEFGAPMSQGEAWKHIRLLNASEDVIEQPFLEIDQEMWDAEGRRLTVLFDPGRIKRGVKPLEDIGPSIEAGRSYTLHIDRAWKDATGAPMIEDGRKPFRVVEADRTPIDPARWQVSTVRTGTTEPLMIDFGESLDAALALRLIKVKGKMGTKDLGEHERSLRFTPDTPWESGPYTLNVDTTLEDLAGNKVGRAFDVDTFQRVDAQVTARQISIPIRVRR